MKKNVLILGSGKIGGAIARFLHGCGDYHVCLGDRDAHALELIKEDLGVETMVLDVTDEKSLRVALQGRERVISALPYFVNPGIARACLELGLSYFDLTEDRETTRVVREIALAANPGQVFMPQCGLAPGFISILANDLCQGFDKLEKVKMRVGALPQYPSNMLMYNLTWSTDGLINEYCNPCEAIHGGRMVETMALEGLELFSLDGVNYEAFNTSGGLGTLCETLEGRVTELNYKTVRYKGHQYLMDFLVNSLKMGQRRDIMKDILEHAVPITMQDVVLVFCAVNGWQDGQLVQASDARKIYSKSIDGVPWSSIQITTAAGVCAVVDMQAHGKLGQHGFIRQEDVSLTDFMTNRFGQHYTPDKGAHTHSASIEHLKDFTEANDHVHTAN